MCFAPNWTPPAPEQLAEHHAHWWAIDMAARERLASGVRPGWIRVTHPAAKGKEATCRVCRRGWVSWPMGGADEGGDSWCRCHKLIAQGLSVYADH